MVVGLLIALLLSLGPAQDDRVRLDFPEGVELKVLIDYVATTLHLNVVYEDEALQGRKVTLRVGEAVPKTELLALLQTILRGRGLALIPSEPTGWYRVLASDKIASEGGSLLHDLPPGTDESDIVTLVLPVHGADLQRLQTAIQPLLTKPGATIFAAPESRALIITDFARNVRRCVEIAALLDVEAAGSRIESIPVKYQEPAELGELISRLLASQDQLGSGMPVATSRPADLRLQPDPIERGLIAIGSPDLIARARVLIGQYDRPVERKTEVYSPRFITATRLAKLADTVIGTSGVRIAPDDTSNTLTVAAGPEIHQRLRELIERFDRAPSTDNTPMRFYKLLNRRAVDAFATLGGLLGGSESRTSGVSTAPKANTPTSRPALAGRESGYANLAQPAATEGSAPGSGGVLSIQGENFSISVDEHTNTIIAIAPPELHRQIEMLVKALDKRRPQVLVEVTLVSISIDDSLDLGVELEQLDLGDPWDYLLFTSFGLSTINPTDGTRRMTPLPGGSGALIAPHEVPIIINALAGSGKTRIYSAPRILVDDNATGQIESVAESPFTSVNASTTVATTSFAGFAKAGTQLSIEPHIAEGDHLEIKYDLTVSSFTGSGVAGTPPPRSSDTISSTVRVPDGYSVVVGGLQTETTANAESQVPLIGEVPILGFLFGNRTRSTSKVRLYAFIRPTVLRNENFEDLRYLSTNDLEAAGVPGDLPPDRYQFMK